MCWVSENGRILRFLEMLKGTLTMPCHEETKNNRQLGIIKNLRAGNPASEIGMGETPCSLSDHIAFDQFLLAIERNLLLHVTTSLNMTVVGIAMFRFFSRTSSDIYVSLGIVAFVVALAILSKGIIDWARMRRILRTIPEGTKKTLIEGGFS